MRELLHKNQLLFMWIVAICATSGSLYFSEIKGFIPCDWCWYQRILMYPMVIVLGIATFKKDKNILSYIKPIAFLGLIIAAIHYLEQKVGLVSMINGKGCSSIVPCSGEYMNSLGFITIPLMSFVAFTIIFLLANIKPIKNKKENNED